MTEENPTTEQTNLSFSEQKTAYEKIVLNFFQASEAVKELDEWKEIQKLEALLKDARQAFENHPHVLNLRNTETYIREVGTLYPSVKTNYGTVSPVKAHERVTWDKEELTKMIPVYPFLANFRDIEPVPATVRITYKKEVKE